MTTLSPPSRHGSGSAIPNLQRVVLLPGVVLILLGAGSVAWLLADDPTGTRRSAVLGGALAIAVVILIAAALSARSAQRTATRSTAALRADLERATAGMAATLSFGDAQLRRALEELRQGRTPKPPATPTEPRETYGPFGPLLTQLEYSQLTAFTAVTEAAELTIPDEHATQQVTVLVNLARRLQSLVHQGIKILDELEQQVEDPDLLRGLFEVDHIATRIRRYVENVAVLGGEVTRRQWRRPVPLASVVRSAIGEVERYSRVKPVPPIDGRIDGAAVADVVHLLAELIENATAFSPPGTQVHVRTQKVTTGLVVEIEDRGLGQEPEDERMRNALLANPERVELGALLHDGRVGLYVVAVLARQHQIRVELRRNLFGGVTSLVLLPNPLLSSDEDEVAEAAEAAAGEDSRRTAQAQHAQRGERQGHDEHQLSLPGGAGSAGRRSGRGQHARAVESGDRGGLVAGSLPTSYPSAASTPNTQYTPPPMLSQGEPDRWAAQNVAAHASAQGSGAQNMAGQNGAGQAGAAPSGRPVPPALPELSPGPLRGRAENDRPPLPQRTQQAHMAPQLQRQPPPQQYGHGYRVPEEPEFTPANPGLMATYRRGVRAAEEQAPHSDEYSDE